MKLYSRKQNCIRTGSFGGIGLVIMDEGIVYRNFLSVVLSAKIPIFIVNHSLNSLENLISIFTLNRGVARC